MVNITSWNINGLRSCISKGELQSLIQRYNPDILFLADIKTTSEINIVEFARYPYIYWSFAPMGSKGMSSVALSKIRPSRENKRGGRIISLEFDEIVILFSFFPYAGDHLEKLDFNINWIDMFNGYISSIKKDMIVMGDLNVILDEDKDLADYYNGVRFAGNTQEEMMAMNRLIASNKLTDTFRYFHKKC